MNITHDKLQQQCFQHLWNTYPQTRRTCWHTPNELSPHKGESTLDFKKRIFYRKAIGVLPGVVDLIWIWDKIYLFDIKMPGDKVSEDQNKFIEAVRGVFYEIRELSQFENIVNSIIEVHPNVLY